MWPILLRQPPLAAPRAESVPHRRFVPMSTPWMVPAPKRGGLYRDEPEACRRNLRDFAAIWTHLGLLVAVVRVYHIEGRGLLLLAAVALLALPIHYLLPYRWKKHGFVAASFVGLGAVFGPATTLFVTACAALLIGACYLPIAWSARAGVVAALAVALGCARAWSDSLPVSNAVWPLLGSMFMFRMIIFLYELKHADKPERPIDVIGYFFLLPNYCFPHFPVVDYRTLLRGDHATNIHAIQRRGLEMMTRGVTHLVLYRLIYHRLLITPSEVTNLASLAGFLACNYLLYLRVSGQFHMACGMLHLFGYQLPDTHHHYLFATGFTDYWRRINIYWKDFMVRVVFNPVVFRLKRWPQPWALGVATATVFLTTWALHAYQSFWIRGSWGFSVTDALFWGVLGLLVLVNVQNDARRPRRLARAVTKRDLALRVVKVAGTFTTLALLWSLWSSPSLDAWLAMLKRGIAGSA